MSVHSDWKSLYAAQSSESHKPRVNYTSRSRMSPDWPFAGTTCIRTRTVFDLHW